MFSENVTMTVSNLIALFPTLQSSSLSQTHRANVLPVVANTISQDIFDLAYSDRFSPGTDLSKS